MLQAGVVEVVVVVAAAAVVPALTPATPSNKEIDYGAVFAVREAARGTDLPVT